METWFCSGACWYLEFGLSTVSRLRIFGQSNGFTRNALKKKNPSPLTYDNKRTDLCLLSCNLQVASDPETFRDLSLGVFALSQLDSFSELVWALAVLDHLAEKDQKNTSESQ